nr:MAG TPA: hypothetical protein [Caudoviricetes sp.]
MVQIGFSSSNRANSVIVDEHFTLFVIIQNGNGCLDDGVCFCTLASPGKDRTHFGLVRCNTPLTQLEDKPDERKAVLLNPFTNSVKFLHGGSLLSQNSYKQ